MKVYTKVVIDMSSGNVIEEHSHEYNGPVALCGGGGASGEVRFPDYMEHIHVDWMTGGTTSSPNPTLSTTMEAVMDTALGGGGNPFSSELAYDPSTPIDAMQTEHDDIETLIDAIDPEGSSGMFEDLFDKARTEVDEHLPELTFDDADDLEPEIQASVDAFTDSAKAREMQDLSVWAGGMADINAVHSSQFIMGMALRAQNLTNEVNRFEKDLRLQNLTTLRSIKDRNRHTRQTAIFQAVQMMFEMHRLKATASLDLVRSQSDISRMEIIAKQTETDRNLEIDVMDAEWDLKVFQYGSNLLAAIHGAANPVMDGMSKTASTLSGALSGASTGAAIGSAVPGIGTGLGAGIGAVVGSIGGYFS